MIKAQMTGSRRVAGGRWWRSLKSFAAVAALALLGLPAHAGGPEAKVTLGTLLREMTDRDSLARLAEPHFVLKQTSSHDPAKRDPGDEATWHSNHDYEQFIRTEVNAGRREWVIMDETGPGAITRFWLPLNPDRDKQVIRIYLDDNPTPVISAKFNDLLSGRDFVHPPFAFVAWNDNEMAGQARTAPVTLRGVAGDLYLPIPFARRCKITLDSMPFYYVINYRSYAPGTSVRSFSMEQMASESSGIERASQLLSETPPALPPGSPTVSARLAPGAEVSLMLPHGESAVRDLQIHVDPGAAREALRSLLLTAQFDGEPTLWCPLSEFFGAGARLRAVHDRFRRVEASGDLRAFWTMPYRETGAITLKNLGSAPQTVTLSASTGRWRWDRRSLHFHANWHCSLDMKTRPRSDWNYIEAAGSGQYAGDTLTVFSPVVDWYGEGDERIYVDGETFPAHIGTGTEDYYGYAWGMASYFSSPYLSTPHRDIDDRADWRGYTTTSRLRLLDDIPMDRSLKVDMEIWNWADTRVDYAVGTFWYGRPGATTNRDPQPAEAAVPVRPAPAVPTAFRIDGAIECEEMKVVRHSDNARVSVQNAGLTAGQWSGGRQLFVQAKAVGDFIELEVPAPAAGPYRLTLYGTKSFDYGVLKFQVNGAPSGKEQDMYSAASAAYGPIDLGVAAPVNGRFLLRVEVAGRNADARGSGAFFGLDCITLTKP